MDRSKELVYETGQNLFRTVEVVTKEAILEAARAGSGKSGALHVVLNAAASILSTAAELVANHKKPDNFEDFNPATAVTPEVILFTALLFHASSPSVDEDGGIVTSTGPQVFAAAIEAYEKLTGSTIDRFLAPEIVRAARSCDGRITKHLPPEYVDGRPGLLN